MTPPPDVFAAVMATGIVSIAAADHHYDWISAGLATVAAVALPVLVVVAATAWKRTPLDVRDPDVLVRMFTFVAACAVLASRFEDRRFVLWVLAAITLQTWMTLMPMLVRRMWKRRWTGLRDRAHGAWELASVATSGVALVCADLELLFLAVLFWVIAILIYFAMTTLILWRTVHERIDRDGFEPDTWILMGGLAIATLAGDHIHRIWSVAAVEYVTIGTWALATLWIPPLLYFGIKRLARDTGSLRFTGIWWAMVFPLGMYSAATFAMALETGATTYATVSLVFFWFAFAVWLAVAAAAIVPKPATG